MELTAAIIQKYAKRSTAKLKLRAQECFNAYIRHRDKGQPCISCQQYRTLEAGHFYSAGHHNLIRFDEDNCHGQCSACNRHLSGNLLHYRRYLEIKIGKDRLAALDDKGAYKKAVPDDRFLFIEVIEKYKKYTAKAA